MALWLRQALKPKTPNIRIPLVKGFLEVMQSNSYAHLGPFALVRARLHFNKPFQLIPLKQGLKDCKEAKAREGISAHLSHSPFSAGCHTHQFIHPSNKQTNKQTEPATQFLKAVSPSNPMSIIAGNFSPCSLCPFSKGESDGHGSSVLSLFSSRGLRNSCNKMAELD